AMLQHDESRLLDTSLGHREERRELLRLDGLAVQDRDLEAVATGDGLGFPPEPRGRAFVARQYLDAPRKGLAGADRRTDPVAGLCARGVSPDQDGDPRQRLTHFLRRALEIGEMPCTKWKP